MNYSKLRELLCWVLGNVETLVITERLNLCLFYQNYETMKTQSFISVFNGIVFCHLNLSINPLCRYTCICMFNTLWIVLKLGKPTSRMTFQAGNSVLIDSAQGEFPNFSSSYIGVFQSAETTA